MKVIKLNEASVSSVMDAKDQYNNAADNTEKAEIVKRFLIDNGIVKSSIVEKLMEYGPTFIVDWVNAMKWEELGRDDNEFIYLLQNIKPESVVMSNPNNFTKAYNAYSDGSFDKSYMNDDNVLGQIFLKMLLDFQLYRESDADFRETFKIYDSLRNNSRVTEEDIRNIFLEDPSRQDSDINLLSVIKQRANNIGGYRSKNRVNVNNRKDAEELMDNLLAVDGMREYAASKLQEQ